MQEQWRSHRWPYEVSDRGRVRNVETGVIRKARLEKTGYYALNLAYDGTIIRRKVHQLVLEAFVGPRPEGAVARHINGDSCDNRLDNLAWGTMAENAADTIRHGRTCRGEKNHSAKLTAEQVVEIRRSARRGADLAREFGVSKVLIGKVRRRECWAWL